MIWMVLVWKWRRCILRYCIYDIEIPTGSQLHLCLVSLHPNLPLLTTTKHLVMMIQRRNEVGENDVNFTPLYSLRSLDLSHHFNVQCLP